MLRPSCVWCLTVFCLTKCLGSVPVVAQETEAKISYARDIRPILADKCFACHGADANTRAADLRLDQFEAAVEGGAIVPRDPAASEMIVRINLAADDSALMPPVSSHKALTDREREILWAWIQEGAVYEAHWAFAAPVEPPLPQTQNQEWPTNDLDRFVLARLEQRNLQPNPPADPATLIRRLSLDITGLPPSPEDVQSFLRDPSPAAYEALIDKWMATPAWGEHRGRYWLDLARYADTHGIHFDNYREIWAYRDWVIDAFNQNMPFDQFTIEQLAGDLLPNPTLDQQIASGFNRCNITTNEGGVIEEEYRVLYAIDRTETTAQTWMGLTVGCAACHDHKFDPISQSEFYQLSAFFNNTTQPVMDGNIPQTPPTVFVPRKAERQRWEDVKRELNEAKQARDQRRQTVSTGLDAWLRQPEATQQLLGDPDAGLTDGLQWHVPTGPIESQLPWTGPQPQQLSVQSVADVDGQHPWALRADRFTTPPQFAGVGDLEGDQPFTLAAWIRFSGNQNSGALLSKMFDGEGYRGWDLWGEGGRVGMHLVHSWPDNALKVVTRDPVPSDQWQHVTVTYDGSRKAAGVRIYVNGAAVPTVTSNDRLSETMRNDLDVVLFKRHGTGTMSQLALDDVRLYTRGLEAPSVMALAQRNRLEQLRTALANPPAGDVPPLSDELRELALNRYLTQLDAEYPAMAAKVAALEKEQAEIRGRGTLAHVMNERLDQTPTAYVLFRGEYDQRREQVTANTPAMLPQLPEDGPKNRLGLARWLVSDDHPLTTRVTVNQFWQSVFGQGLVATSGDFGLTGTLPTHPELLDYLAVEFREDGWDVQRFFKRIFLSSTYRQSAQVSAEKLEIDVDNAWLSRGPRFRMDAEMIRDYALAASGILVPEVGGPSVRPYQPPGVWEAVAMIGSNTRDYRQDQGAGLYRRSMYTLWKRSAPPASMDIFNAPSREGCTVRRERTNTPLQALATLNDPQMIEAARYLATQILQRDGAVSWHEPTSDAGDGAAAGFVAAARAVSPDQAALDAAAWRVLCRPLVAAESEVLLRSLQHLQEYYQAHPEDATALIAVGETPVPTDIDPDRLAAWTLLINQLLNLDEVVNK